MRLLLLFTLIAILAAVPAPVSACAAVGPDGSRIDITAEAALIVWDEANRTEHFIRRASFESSAYDFGFLVPTPTLPEVDESDDAVFDRLADITKPKTEYRTRTAELGCFSMSAKFAASDAAGESDGVIVLQEKKLGEHDVVSIQFNPKAGTVERGSQALADWLVRYGYGFGTTLKEWIEPYVKQGWVITAFRITGTTNNRDVATKRSDRRSELNRLRAKPVRLTFKTDRPFYPYREPADQRDRTDERSQRFLKVFFASDQRVLGTIGESKPFHARTAWADKLQDGERADVIARAKLPAGAGPKQWFLTEFLDTSSPRPGTDEIWFRPSPDQSPVARPPYIIYQDSYTLWWVGLAVCLGLPLVTFIALRLKRKAA